MITIGRLSKKFYNAQIIQLLFRGQGRLSILFAEKYTSNELADILMPIVNSGQPEVWKPSPYCPVYFFTKWSAYSVLAYYNIEMSFDPSEDFYLMILEQSQYPWIKSLSNYLKLGQEAKIPYSEYSTFAELLQMFYNFLPGLYRSIQGKINYILSKIPGKELFAYLKLDLFVLKTDLNNQIIQSFPIELIQPKTIKEYISNLVLLKNSMDALRLQSLAIYNEPYPRKSLLFEQNRMFTLVNQIIRKNQNVHFIDEIVSHSIRELMSGKLDSAADFANDLPQFFPYIVLASYQLQPDQQKFCNILVSVMKITKNKILQTVYDAMNNDQNLLSTLYKITGTRVTLSTFEYKSIPFVLYPMIDSLTDAQLNAIFGKTFFNISNDDRSLDASFIYAYFALMETMQVIIGRKKSDKLPKYLDLIETDYVLDSVITDIISLIFLKIGNRYMCDVDKAEYLLSSISGYMYNPQLFNSANMKISYARVRGFKELQDCLVHPQTVVSNLLKNHYTDIAPALQLCADNKPLRDKIFLIKEIRELMNGKFIWQIQVNNRDRLGAEYFLSFGDQILPLNTDDGAVKIIFERRKQSLNQEPLDIVQSQSIKAAVSYYEAGYFEGRVFPNFSLFSSFCSYINLITRLSGISTKAGAQSIVDILNNSSNYSWDDIKVLLGPNALEVALQYSRRIDMNSVFYKLMKANDYLVALAIAVDRKTDAGLSISPMMSKYLNLASKKEIKFYPTKLSDVFQVIQYYEDGLTEIPQDILAICAEIAFKERSIEAMNTIWEKNQNMFKECNAFEFSLSEINRLHFFAHIRTAKAIKYGFTSFLPVDPIIVKFCQNCEFQALSDLMEDLNINVIPYLKQTCLDNYQIAEKVRNCPIPKFRIMYKELPRREEMSYYDSLKLDFDKILPNAAKVYEDLPKIAKLFAKIKRDPKPQQNLLDYFIRRVVEIVSFLTVFSGGLEARANVLMKRLCRVLEKNRDISGESTIDKIITLGHFVSIFPYTKTGKKYDFNDFMDEHKGKLFATICSEMNERQLMLQFCALWRLDFCPFIFQRALVCFKQSFIDEGCKELDMVKTVVQTNHAKISAVSPESKEMIEVLIQTLSNTLLFDMRDEVIRKDREWKGRRGELYEAIMDVFSNECLMYMTKHKNTVDIMQYTFKLLESIDIFPVRNRWSGVTDFVTFSSQQMKALTQYLDAFNETRRLIYLLSTVGEFEPVFKQLDKVPSAKKINHFRSTVVYPALANSNWSKLWRLVNKSFKQKVVFIDQFFQFLSKNGMNRTMYDIQMKLNLYEDAMKSAVDGYSLANKWQTCLQIVRGMRDAIKKRMTSEMTEVAVKRSSMTPESLSLMMMRVEIQEKLIIYFIKNKVPFSTDLEIIKSRENAEATSIFLLKQNEYTLLLDVLSTGISPSNVFRSFIRKLSKEGPTAINKYCLAMPTKDEMIYETTITNLTCEMAKMTTNRNSLKGFIDTCVKTDRAKAEIMMQNEFYVEALNIMKKRKKDFMLQIRSIKDLAERKGDNAAFELAKSLVK